MSAYIKTPFAASGDRTAIPDAVQPDGSVSAAAGFGLDYELDPATNPSALNVPRNQTNQVLYETQVAVQVIQQHGFPDFITSADNGGVAFPYAINSTCRGPDGNNYSSLIDANTDTPPSANWQRVIYGSQFATGDFLPWMFSAIRAGGWVWLNGMTIGNAASNATQRNNADTAALFAKLWGDFSNTVLPIQDSTGAASTRGTSAAIDFAANKRLPTPDMLERTFFGSGTAGGATDPQRITVAKSTISGATIGATGGLETVQLTGNQNGPHIHTGLTAQFQEADNPNPPFNSIIGDVHAGSPATLGGATVGSSGLGSDHQNMPPCIIGGGWIMKL